MQEGSCTDICNSTSSNMAKTDAIGRRGFEEIVPICRSMEPDLNASDMPYPRSGHRLVANDRFAVAIGGYNPSLWNENNSPETYYPILKEVWVFNLATLRWKKLTTSGSMPKELASHAALLHDNYIVVYGGTGVPFGHNSTNKVHVLNLTKGTWRMLSVTSTPDQAAITPPEQYGHAFVRHKKKLYITGGTSGFDFNMQVFELSVNETASPDSQTVFQCRSLLRGPELSPRYRHEAFCFDGKLYAVGGGKTNTVCPLDQIAVFDISTGQWSSVTTVPDPEKGFPAPRRCHGLAAYEDPSAHGQQLSVYISGGYDGSQGFDDVWELRITRQGSSAVQYKWHRFPYNLPRRLYFHGMAATPSGSLLIFGGVDSESDERSAILYRCWLKPPTLLELALQKIITTMGNSDEGKVAQVADKLKLPQTCIDWINNRF